LAYSGGKWGSVYASGGEGEATEVSDGEAEGCELPVAGVGEKGEWAVETETEIRVRDSEWESDVSDFFFHIRSDDFTAASSIFVTVIPNDI
jgi:hypothetical protein